MSPELVLRYSLELSLIFPAVIFAVMPVTRYLRFKSFMAFCTAGVMLAFCVFAGAYAGVYHKIRVRFMFVPFAVMIFMLYFMAVDAEAGKKLFCFFNAAMLCELCPMYAMFIAGPVELLNFSRVFMVQTGLICLGVSIVAGLIFYRTLTVKIPTLLNEENIKDVWSYMFLIPLVMAGLIYWMTPNSPRVVMTGRVRPISLVLVTIITASIFVIYHIFWWAVSRMTESADLRRENDLLQMESKRYNELKGYMNATREMRHNFRQHIFVISELADSGRYGELEEYLAQFREKTEGSYRSYCLNSAVDAVASHYDRTASRQGASISWRLELPPVLPVKELDYCAMLGNLLENALNAVSSLPPEKRKVEVISSMLSDAMLGLSVDNPYSGAVIPFKDGLPDISREGHGTGLVSVMNTVNHYGGSMNITTGGNIFSVDIILYSNP
ncbi:MAG: sensor histidine kinase [Synergistaceae bacterium]|nr:sensor histidine kinase [Synergistaceae bacterium]